MTNDALTFTPEWEYFDIKKNAPYFGWAMSRKVLHVLTVPEEWRGDEPDEPANVDDDEKPNDGRGYSAHRRSAVCQCGGGRDGD